MCGICGIFRLRADAPEPDLEELRRVREAMAARGPDGTGEWRSPDGALLLGHRRLAILDLSPAGAQPMASADGRFRIVYNGEVYNFRQLRAELETKGERFRSESDTEVILALWSREGPQGIARMRGMYALAIWDGAERTLTLVRDPFGIKPLYYATEGGCLRFASQVRALEAGGSLSREVDPGGLGGFLMWGSVPEPRTIRRAIRALPAGHLLTAGNGGTGEPEPLPYPSAPSAVDSVDALESSVEAHLVSDVPVAVFLSSGMDSSLIAALAAKHLSDPLRTFTVTLEGWEGTARDEGPLARRVAEAIGARHVGRKLGRAEVAALWPEALAAMDQPSIDGFNTFVVARAAHEAGIKVALSGLGGDELLGSYPSFRDVPRWSARVRRLQRLFGAPVRKVPNSPQEVPAVSRAFAAGARQFAPSRPKLSGLMTYGASPAGAYYLRRGLFLPEELAGILGADQAREALTHLQPVTQAETALTAPTPFSGSLCLGEASGPGLGSDPAPTAWHQVQRLEVALYLRNQLLRDSDWAAMASSLELRVPMVDPILWAQVARHGHEPARSQGKAAVVRVAAPNLPAELWNRPKSGFTVPVAEWMCPPRPRERDTAGKGSRRLAMRILEERDLCPAR
ncbi:MAG: asparagine synthase (glutamine-hydrolyzing) [Acidobacteria bacterium]|nr:asparagine synthase (glutamine-hydrolyzing) [Acidobacteriota bacterium]